MEAYLGSVKQKKAERDQVGREHKDGRIKGGRRGVGRRERDVCTVETDVQRKMQKEQTHIEHTNYRFMYSGRLPSLLLCSHGSHCILGSWHTESSMLCS